MRIDLEAANSSLAFSNEQLRHAKIRISNLEDQIIRLASSTRFDPRQRQWVITQQDAEFFKVTGFLSTSSPRRNDRE